LLCTERHHETDARTFLILSQKDVSKGECYHAANPLKPLKPEFKKYRFCRHYDIKRFTLFTSHPKSETEIGS
jgi:hypothetical protein